MDLSDECFCEESEAEVLCQTLLSNDELTFKSVCNLEIDLPNNIDEKFCSHEMFDPYEYDPEIKGPRNRKKYKTRNFNNYDYCQYIGAYAVTLKVVYSSLYFSHSSF